MAFPQHAWLCRTPWLTCHTNPQFGHMGWLHTKWSQCKSEEKNHSNQKMHGIGSDMWWLTLDHVIHFIKEPRPANVYYCMGTSRRVPPGATHPPPPLSSARLDSGKGTLRLTMPQKLGLLCSGWMALHMVSYTGKIPMSGLRLGYKGENPRSEIHTSNCFALTTQVRVGIFHAFK